MNVKKNSIPFLDWQIISRFLVPKQDVRQIFDPGHFDEESLFEKKAHFKSLLVSELQFEHKL